MTEAQTHKECMEMRCSKAGCHLIAHVADLLPDFATGILNFFLSREKHQNVALWLTEMDLHNSPDGCFQVIPLWLLSVENLHRMQPSRDLQNFDPSVV